jgi:hypothetical protein
MSIRTITLITLITTLAAISVARPARAEEQTPEERKQLIEGAHLWSIYCNQCHNARPGSEFAPAQWDAITMHMRTLSNMPAKDMRAIRAFLEFGH